MLNGKVITLGASIPTSEKSAINAKIKKNQGKIEAFLNENTTHFLVSEWEKKAFSVDPTKHMVLNVQWIKDSLESLELQETKKYLMFPPSFSECNSEITIVKKLFKNSILSIRSLQAELIYQENLKIKQEEEKQEKLNKILEEKKSKYKKKVSSTGRSSSKAPKKNETPVSESAERMKKLREERERIKAEKKAEIESRKEEDRLKKEREKQERIEIQRKIKEDRERLKEEQKNRVKNEEKEKEDVGFSLVNHLNALLEEEKEKQIEEEKKERIQRKKEIIEEKIRKKQENKQKIKEKIQENIKVDQERGQRRKLEIIEEKKKAFREKMREDKERKKKIQEDWAKEQEKRRNEWELKKIQMRQEKKEKKLKFKMEKDRILKEDKEEEGRKVFVGKLSFEDIQTASLDPFTKIHLIERRKQELMNILKSYGAFDKVKENWEKNYLFVVYYEPISAEKAVAELSQFPVKKKILAEIKKNMKATATNPLAAPPPNFYVRWPKNTRKPEPLPEEIVEEVVEETSEPGQEFDDEGGEWTVA